MITPDFTNAHWHKSSHSNGNQACVELAFVATEVGVRDSKAPTVGHLTISHSAFASFLAQAKDGGFDRQQ